MRQRERQRNKRELAGAIRCIGEEVMHRADEIAGDVDREDKEIKITATVSHGSAPTLQWTSTVRVLDGETHNSSPASFRDVETRPCPCCGGEAILVATRRGFYWLECADCGHMGDLFDSVREAAYWWNKEGDTESRDV